MNRRIAAFVVSCVAVFASLAFAQSEGVPNTSGTLQGPLTVVGPVTMTTGPMSINGSLTATGNTTLGPTVTLNGPTSTTGAFTFGVPPTGLARGGTLTRGSSLSLGIGCASLGTVTVAGVVLNDVCKVTSKPAGLSTVTVDCDVTSVNTVTVTGCGLVALVSAPAGNYVVRVLPGG